MGFVRECVRSGDSCTCVAGPKRKSRNDPRFAHVNSSIDTCMHFNREINFF